MVLTAQSIKSVEERSVQLGMSWLRLMENAGSAAARIIRKSFDLKGKKVCIVCGKGNNGGDGYVIARKLIENSAVVRVIAVGQPSTPSAEEMAQKAQSLNIRPIDFNNYKELCNQYITDSDIIVDAVFGTGFKGKPEGIYLDVINAMNKSKGTKIAIDVPSGINSDTGVCDGVHFKADITVTFAAYKPCHILTPAFKECGKIVVVPIGIPDEAFTVTEPCMTVVDSSIVTKSLPHRDDDFHKGDCGTVGVYCGCKGFAGAAVIAGKSAVKSGAGIVNMIIPNSIYNIVGMSIPEAVCTVLDDVEPQSVLDSVAETVIEALDRCTAGLVGCGLGQSNQTIYTVAEIMKNCSIPLVIDADGINILSRNIELIKRYTNDVVITPHPKEASRLLGISVEDIQSDRLTAVKRLTELTGAVSVLKGARTLIATPKGNVYAVVDGNSGMATAGTGDMLAGMIAAFLSQGITAEMSAVCATKLHAVAGDVAVNQTSVLSLTPTDMINELPTVLNHYYSM